jgi:hypothetical protein
VIDSPPLLESPTMDECASDEEASEVEVSGAADDDSVFLRRFANHSLQQVELEIEESSALGKLGAWYG